MRHVGDRDHQTVATWRPRDVDGIIEIARILAVDGDQRQMAQIAPPSDLLGMHMIGHALRGDQRRRIEFVGESLRVCASQRLELRIAPAAEHRDDLALQRSLDLAMQAHVLGKGAVVGNHPLRLPLGLVDPKRELAAALDDLEHFSRQTAIAPPDGPGADDVAVQRPSDVLRRDEEIVFAPSVAEQR